MPRHHHPSQSLNLANSATPEPINLRKRIRTACTRCKTRKQKCDERLPVCSNCLRAGAECDKADVATGAPPIAYTKALEDRVALLEMELLARERADRSHYPEAGRNGENSDRPLIAYPVTAIRPRSNPSPGFSPQPNSEGEDTGLELRGPTSNNPQSDALNEVVGIISAGNFQAPAYVGLSAGLSLAVNLSEMVQATVWKTAIPEIYTRGHGQQYPPRPWSHRASTHESDTQGCLEKDTSQPRWRNNTSTKASSRALTMEELVRNSSKEPPSDEIGARIVRTYFRRLHPRYPFLDPDEIWHLHAQRNDLVKKRDVTLTERFSIFKLYMVYAVGATLLNLVEKNLGLSPESFYMTSLQHIAAAKESRTIENIEAMALLLVYHLRSASSHGLWYMAGLAIRTCIDLGIHRKSYEDGLSKSIVDKRRRLFWSVYSLERVIAISLGRPLSITDREIDVDFPVVSQSRQGSHESPSAESNFSNTSPAAQSEAASYHFAEDRQPSEDSPAPGDMRMAVILFRLRRIESRIHHSIYRVDKPLTQLLPKLDRLYQSLEQWRESLAESYASGSPDFDYALLHYNRAVRTLIQPFLTLLPSSNTYYGLCMRAAGDICQQHKRLHQTVDYGHSFIAVQTVFVAGVTLLYGLWTQGHQIWSVASSDDIRACSLVLFVMGERAPWVRKYRDAFEIMLNAAMEKLRNDEMEVNRGIRGTATFNEGEQSENRRKKRRYNEANEEVLDYDEESGIRKDPASGSTGDMIGDILGSAGGWPGNNSSGGANGEDKDAWKVVMELANWIDQDKGPPVWMPNFEVLQNLSSVSPQDSTM